jgi:sortase A
VISHEGRTSTRAPSPARQAVGEILITAALLIALFAIYQLFWSNHSASRAAQSGITEVTQAWESTDRLTPDDRGAQPQAGVRKPVTDVFAILHIPALGKGWSAPVVEGVGVEDLRRGVGHFPKTQMPGVNGNFAVAGHRATQGEPFRDLDRLVPGELIGVELREVIYVYRVLTNRIVAPTRTELLLPVPGKLGVTPTKAVMTLVTCHPRWSSEFRMVVIAELEGSFLKSQAPKALGGR